MTIDEAFRVLGIPNTSPVTVVKKRFRVLALKTHPDRGGTTEAFTRVREAYETVLKFVIDPVTADRNAYFDSAQRNRVKRSGDFTETLNWLRKEQRIFERNRRAGKNPTAKPGVCPVCGGKGYVVIDSGFFRIELRCRCADG
jgi:DnaJ-class molecular chaperone